MFFPATPQLTLHRRGDWRRFWPDDVVLFARARFALTEGLRALARARGVRRVWMPAFICGPVPEAIVAAGLRPLLYDVDERLDPRLDTIAPSRGDALLIVHYFGLLAALPRIRAFAAEHAMSLVEDCAHALPDPGHDGAGSAGDVVVWSLRKLGPMPGGGLLAVRDAAVRRCVTAPRERALPDARTLARLAIMLAERATASVGWNPLRWKDRLPVLDATEDHAEPAPAPPALDPPPPPPAARLVRAMLEHADWGGVLARRRAAYRRLADRLAGVAGLALAAPDPARESVPEAFPVFARDVTVLVARLRHRGIEAMRWPGTEQIPFDPRQFPGAQAWLARSVCLPLGTSLAPADVDRLARVVHETVAAAPTNGVAAGAG